MELTFKDRLVFGSLYPAKGSILIQTIVSDIQDKVSLSQDDMVKANLRLENKQYKWDTTKVKPIEVEFTHAELNFLKERVQELDKKEEVEFDCLALFKKIQTEPLKKKKVKK